MATVEPTDVPNESKKNSKVVLGDFLSELDLKFCADDYAKYIKVDVTTQIKMYDNIIDDMLVRLDDFCQTADMMRSESGMCMTDLLPRIITQSKELPAVFEKIDQLQKFITAVQRNVDELEERVNKAEKELGASTVKGLLSSLPIKRFRQTKEAKPANIQWTPITFTDLKQYFSTEQHTVLGANNSDNTNTQDDENI